MPLPRLAGLDGARAIALLGMMLSHYAGSIRASDPGWLQAIDNAADGRAAPLFCVLLGLGAGVLMRRRGPLAALRRGLVLLGVGVAVWPLFDAVYLILPHYGVLLILAGLAHRLPTRLLLPLAAACWLVPTIAAVALDGADLRSALQPSDYGDLADVPGLAWQVLWTGGYPVAGWAGFAVIGLWLSRLRLGERAVQLRLLVGGSAVAALQPLLAVLRRGVTDGGADPSRSETAASVFLETTAHSNHLGWYLVSAGSATAVVAAASLAARSRILPAPVATVGRFALSAYLLHLVIGELFVWPWRDRSDPSLAAQMGVTLAVFASIGVLAVLWSKWFRHGPLELVVRRIAR